MEKNHFKILLLTFFGLCIGTAFAQGPTLYLSSSGNYNVIEGNTRSFTVNLYSASTTPITVTLTTIAETADSSDYVSLSTTITIPAGQIASSATTLQTINDALAESDETVRILATVTSGNTENLTATLSLTIKDNDTIPGFSITSFASSIEGQSGSVSLNLTAPFNSTIAVSIVSAIGTATANDFTPINTVVYIPAGSTSVSVPYSTSNDLIAEINETFILSATVTSGNTTNNAANCTVTIIDNDTIPSLRIGDRSATEGQDVYIYAYLSNPYQSNIVIQFTTTTGTAGSADFTSVTTTRTIAAGSTYTSLTIPTTNDVLDEAVESFTIAGTSAGISNSPEIAIASIVDNDGLPDLSISVVANNETDNSVIEGEEVQLYVRLTHTSPSPTIIDVTTIPETASASDFVPLTTTITIPAGNFSANYLLIPTLVDTLEEATETFTITATTTNGNTYNTSDTAIATIRDNYNVNAYNDQIETVANVGGAVALLANDLLHGLPLNASDVTISLAGNNLGAMVDAQGVLTIPSTVPMGYYQLNYTICETANPALCDTANISVQVRSPLNCAYGATYSDYNGDGFTSVGDLINYVFTITNLGNLPISNIAVEYSWNIDLLGGSIALLDPGASDNTTFTLTHIITQNDINFGFYPQQFELSFKGTYNGYEVNCYPAFDGLFEFSIPDAIRLKAFVDNNANGIQESSEPNFPLGHFTYEINASGEVHYLHSNPFFLYESNPATLYNINYVVDSQYAAYNTCLVSYSDVNVTTGSGVTTLNFPIIVTPHNDLSIAFLNYNQPPRPGFYYNNYLVFKNNSNNTISNGVVTFTKDSALTITGTSQTTTATPTGFTHNFTDLQPYASRYIGIQMLVPPIPTVDLGDLTTNTASISLLSDDINTNNNSDSLTQTIIGAYDPNDKTEKHGSQIVHSSFTANDYLTYTIRFENTGTANAINIRVSDVLDAKLDATSIRMVDASATYTLERVGNNLTWNFFGIDLPPSVENTQIGNGYITFQVKPKPGFLLGDVIPNTANIYFDFNPAIVTNECTTAFVATLGTDTFDGNDFIFYPNPTKNILNIALKNDSDTIDAICVNDVLGKTIIFKKVNNANATIDLSAFAKGFYFVKITVNGIEKVLKIVKE
jgi:uncharacterized repeat protein (TIGR01451 family)